METLQKDNEAMVTINEANFTVSRRKLVFWRGNEVKVMNNGEKEMNSFVSLTHC